MQLKKKQILSWVVRIVAALILLQTLFFKFTAAPESVAIFSTIGIEPWGRIATGIIELVAAILLLMPATSVIGALLGAGVMSGAIFTHLFLIGISSGGDGGFLFLLAIITLTCCVVEIILGYKKYIPLLQKSKSHE
jgi:uncharacterized membrane protein YphA (DoxX/SURF4 family)